SKCAARGEKRLSRAREAALRSLGSGTPRGRERGLARAPCCLLGFDALDERAAWCARARQRPARAQSGLRLSPAAHRLSLRPFAARCLNGENQTATKERSEPRVTPLLSARSRPETALS